MEVPGSHQDGRMKNSDLSFHLKTIFSWHFFTRKKINAICNKKNVKYEYNMSSMNTICQV